jgi:O-antigen ligase
LISLSRGAWLGAIGGAAVVLLRSRLKSWRQVVIPLIVAPAGLIAGWALTSVFNIGPAVTLRIGLVGQLLPGNLGVGPDERTYAFDLAIRSWLEHPVFGWGAGSFGQQYTYLSVNLPAWVGNLEVHALHDSGIVGAIGLGLALCVTVVSLWRSASRSQEPNDAAIRVGLLAACATLLIAYQATEATWLGFTWFVFGLAWAASRKLEAEPVRERPVELVRAQSALSSS